MKKLFPFLVLLSFVLPSNYAQTGLDTAVDFDVTDRFGQQHQLFDILDNDQYVLIEFFAHWCNTCCEIAPDINKLYQNFGCNQGPLHIISIEGAGDETEVLDFQGTCGGLTDKPVITGMEGDGSIVSSDYNLSFFPTVVLIAPDKQIVEVDIWPFSYNLAVDILKSYGIEPSECLTNNVNNQFVSEIDLTPNPVYSSASIEFNLNESGQCNMELINLAGQTVKVILNENLRAGYNKIDFNVFDIANGAYFMRIQTAHGIPQISKLVVAK